MLLLISVFLYLQSVSTNKVIHNSTTAIDSFSETNFVKEAASYGYIAEQHKVTTEDGYILTIFRIPKGVKCQGKVRSTPVLLMHGLLQSANGFLDASPTNGLGFLIPDECYDLWTGNVRGNFYSRSHVKYDPDKDKDFWQFSVDEIGKYDIPATITYILKATGADQLNYIGYSQGGCTFFIMCSERPEFCGKVRLFIGLAPATRHLNTKSTVFRTLSKTVNTFRESMENLGIWEILAKGFPVQGSLSTICNVEILASLICGSTIAAIDSPHPGSVTSETLKNLFDHAPAGTSTMNFARYGQAMKSEKFVKFDYGKIMNIEMYGTPDPPEYDLSKVTVPVVAFQGYNDHIVDMADTEWAMAQLPNVLEFIKVSNPLWNHIDMAYSKYSNETIFAKMKKYLFEHSNE